MILQVVFQEKIHVVTVSLATLWCCCDRFFLDGKTGGFSDGEKWRWPPWFQSLKVTDFAKIALEVKDYYWLVVQPTHLKNISQNGNLPQIGVKIKNIWNHHLENNGPKFLMIKIPLLEK